MPIGKLLCIIVSNLEDVAKFKNFKAEEAAPAAESPMQQVGGYLDNLGRFSIKKYFNFRKTELLLREYIP